MTEHTAGILLLRSLARLARADGVVADAELREIHDIVQELTGMDVSPDLVRAVVDEVNADGPEGVASIARDARDEPLDVRLIVARASYRVLAADGEITGPEIGTFNALLDGLGLPRAMVLEQLD